MPIPSFPRKPPFRLVVSASAASSSADSILDSNEKMSPYDSLLYAERSILGRSPSSVNDNFFGGRGGGESEVGAMTSLGDPDPRDIWGRNKKETIKIDVSTCGDKKGACPAARNWVVHGGESYG